MKKTLFGLIIVNLIFSQLLVVFTYADEQPCKAVSIIFLRGSGQNINHENIDDPLNGKTFGTKEEQSYAFFNNINLRITGINKDLTKEFVSFHNQGGHTYGYKALGADSFLSKASHNTASTIRANAYYESMYDGSDALTQYLKSKIVNCPDQKIVLGGYSQGAQVVGETLPRLTTLERSKIAFAALYGDPKFNTKDGTSVYKKGPWVRGNSFVLSGGILGARVNYLPNDMRGKSASWCDFGDTICTGRNMNDPITRIIGEKFVNPVHSTEYQARWIPQSINEIMGALSSTDVFTKNPPQAHLNTYYRKNGTRPLTDIVLIIDSAGSNEKGIEKLRQDAGAISKSLLKDKNTQVGIVRYSNQTPGIFGSTPTMGWEAYGPTTIQWQLEQNLRSISTDPANTAWTYTPLYAGLNAANTVMERIGRHGAQKQYIIYTNKYPGGVFADGVTVYGRSGKVFVTKDQIIRKMYTLDPVVANAVIVPDGAAVNDDAKNYISNFAGISGGGVTIADANNVGSAFDSAANEFDTSPVAIISEPVQIGSSVFLSGGESYDPNSFITKYKWDCNDDGIYEIQDTQPSVECEYNTAYNGIIGLEVESADGQKAKMYRNINFVPESVAVQNQDLIIDTEKISENVSDYLLKNTINSNFVFAVYDDNGNLIESTNAGKISIDAEQFSTGFVIFKVFINGQEVGVKRVQIKNFPPEKPKEEPKNEIVLSEEDYLNTKQLNDSSEKDPTLPSGSFAAQVITLASQTTSIASVSRDNSGSSSLVSLNNEYLSSFSEQNSQNATIVQTGEENTTANNKEQSVVLGESVIKKSNLPGFIVFIIIFISLVALLLMIIKKANNKLDSI
jgi:hypothetical protein